jgi:hypothetical protein
MLPILSSSAFGQRRGLATTLRIATFARVLVACHALIACGRVGYDPASSTGSNPDAAAGGAVSSSGGDSGVVISTGGGAFGGSTGNGGKSSNGGSSVLGSGGLGVPDAAFTSDGSTPGPDAAAPDASPPAKCGDGVVSAGEECDDKVATATCNANCTFASCGDGIVNTAAGESCDKGDHLSTCSVTCQVETCRAGCTCEWYHGHRYMLCPDKLLSTPAKAQCEAFGMRDVRLDSGEESSFLRLRSQQDAYPKFHIGASDAASEGVWIWEDGTQFWSGANNGKPVGGLFSFWASGEPNNQGGDENCGEIQTIQGFNDSKCDFEAKPFICEQYRDPRAKCGNGVVEAGEACDDKKATATCDADCSPVVCGDGLVNAAAGEVCDDGGQGQYCSANCKQFLCPTGCTCFAANGGNYAACTTVATFRDAAVQCGRAGMALATINDATEDQALRTHATTAGLAAYWAGAVDLDSEGNWIWLDTTPLWSGTSTGTAKAYANFASTAPNGGTAKDCLSVLASGQWTDEDCTTTAAYVCERL